uniref:tryptophan synthase subunit alpha n=1 Tax=Vaginimicrobium propionicum TaxID=1871034 RepID=UPI001570D4B3|nr:tryptophan synthase subunit alpha [Vaginimicrobium propionicum]
MKTAERLGITGQTLLAAKHSSRAGLIGYLPVGYPNIATSIEAMKVLAEYADIIEIGMPFSDPIMDGPTIQYATTRALERGVRTKDLFRAVSVVAQTQAKPTAMIYWNLVEHYGVEAFARDFANAGGCGLITPDLIPEEAEPWIQAADKYGLDKIFLIAPSSSDERIAMTMDAARGWIYASSVMGVTGVRDKTSPQAPITVARARKARQDLPVAVGLGVSNGQQANEVAQFADGVIVGSALVKCLIAAEESGQRLGGLPSLAAELRKGVAN